MKNEGGYTVTKEENNEIIKAIAHPDSFVNKLIEDGIDLSIFVDNLLEFLRKILLLIRRQSLMAYEM